MKISDTAGLDNRTCKIASGVDTITYPRNKGHTWRFLVISNSRALDPKDSRRGFDVI